jgi:hypothetical protein
MADREHLVDAPGELDRIADPVEAGARDRLVAEPLDDGREGDFGHDGSPMEAGRDCPPSMDRCERGNQGLMPPALIARGRGEAVSRAQPVRGINRRQPARSGLECRDRIGTLGHTGNPPPADGAIGA